MSVEEATQAVARLDWFKSSCSSAEGGQCVEVAASADTVHVRDSKDRSGPVLSFATDEWAAFVEFAARD
ncbi:DUF397 domain-containing protein [Streptomyces sp. HB2AG]|uniref:DUF397 domain-containing protein n=1 Tax=Streptomyces sp. HB2AG TaxID=2983400 RepID=UPI0022AA37AF|nr:DUF397 domain-containing protein [Streptomyces sp. HB2AG]MCZ2525365.1 DUF397 domain-containing protein [Streptomyces sp. HB2AG]